MALVFIVLGPALGGAVFYVQVLCHSLEWPRRPRWQLPMGQRANGGQRLRMGQAVAQSTC
ncbi:MAG: hypothetical protein EBU30_12840 [Synechococcaceae bacterium WB6_3B_236]|nr:hypothetical protein [Synechococcaceae bacterium WB6_3B_236]